MLSPNVLARSGPLSLETSGKRSARCSIARGGAPAMDLHRHLVLDDALTPLARGAIALLPIGGSDLVAFDLAEALGQCLARDDELALDLTDRGGELLAARGEIACVASVGVTGFRRGSGDLLLAHQLLLEADR